MSDEGYRPLTEYERKCLRDLLDIMDNMRGAFTALQRVGWAPPGDLTYKRWDDGAEVARALASDTHSLVREHGWSG